MEDVSWEQRQMMILAQIKTLELDRLYSWYEDISNLIDYGPEVREGHKKKLLWIMNEIKKEMLGRWK